MSVVRTLANLLYPPACLLCRTPLPPDASNDHPAADALCTACRKQMPRIDPPVCSRCGLGLRGAYDAQWLCASCRTHPPVFDLARCPWWYHGPAQEAVCQFKYSRRWRLGDSFAQDMAAVARAGLPLETVDAILPVPLHWLKLRLKGFHPPAYLAAAVARLLDKPYLASALHRTRWTRTQTALRGRKRFRNVERAFRARPALVAERTVLLVDDVLTSGATANACAQSLKEAGARQVFLLTAARTPLR